LNSATAAANCPGIPPIAVTGTIRPATILRVVVVVLVERDMSTLRRTRF
jgi:hypothetical protein